MPQVRLLVVRLMLDPRADDQVFLLGWVLQDRFCCSIACYLTDVPCSFTLRTTGDVHRVHYRPKFQHDKSRPTPRLSSEVQMARCMFVYGTYNVRLKIGHEGPDREYRYSCTLSLTSALDGSGWSTLCPGRFTSGKETRCALYRRLGGPQGRYERVW